MGAVSQQLKILTALSEFMDQITTVPSADPDAKNVPKRQFYVKRSLSLCVQGSPDTGASVVMLSR